MLVADTHDQESRAGDPNESKGSNAHDGQDHGAENCRSLRCPVHQWRCDLNGDLVLDGRKP